MLRPLTQCDRALHYMDNVGPLTRINAMEDIGIANLTAVISELRKNGYSVITTMVSAKNRYGQPIQYASYSTVKEN